MANIAPIQQTPVPPVGGSAGGLGEKLKSALVSFWTDAINKVSGTLSDVLRHAVDSTLETLEKPLLQIAGPVLDRAIGTPGIPAEIKGILESARSGEHQVGAILLAFLAIYVLPPLVNALFAAPMKLVEYTGNATFKPNRLDFGSWWLAALRNPAYQDNMARELFDQGWTQEQINAARTVAEKRLDVREAFAAYYRKAIGRADLVGRLLQLGIAGNDVEILIGISAQIPGPGDLVRFGLREAWRDDVAAKYGYDEGMPSEMSEWMEKQGYGEEWSRAFWRSHWEIPSSGQMIEMFHRQQIDHGELVAGLKVNDLAPGWIEPLLGITYNLLTRVDAKRALRYGLYTTDQVFQEYRQQGYDEARARILTSIAVYESIDEAAGMTRAAIVTAYKKGRMSRAESIDSLENIGILGDVAGFYLDQADWDRADELLERKIKAVGERYANGTLDDNQALEQLGALGVGGEEARLDVEDWALSRSTAVKRPSRTNLDEFFTQGIINAKAYREQMATLGYDAGYIGWYLGSLAFDAAKKASAEEERVRKESLAVAADKKSSDYQKGKALIDQDIAQLSAAIADAQVALVEAQNERDQALSQALPARQLAALKLEYEPLFRETDAAIASARLSIQQVQVKITEESGRINDLKRSIAAGRDIVATNKLQAERAAIATELALLDQNIAQKGTDIARLTESIPLLESAEQQADVKQTILGLKTQIAEFQERQADIRIRVREIDELLPVTLTAERRAELDSEIRQAQAAIDEYRLQIEDLEEGIRQTQVERLGIETDYNAETTAVPGRAEQIDIAAEYNASIDVIQARIVELRSDIAQRRLDKAELNVGWRS